MERITLLKQTEAVKLDSARLEQLYLQLGTAGAEDVVCRALEDLAARLSHTERCYREGRLSDLRKSARSLIAIAEQVGMAAVAHVARDVTRCIDDHDRVALAATLSRLLRIGEQSLEEIWDLQDYSL
ncbi:hypothetical protein [Roseovarius aestuariivivens]|uniref:hypothetical protein n=1 Tax=Roseovarius aestuariivivens TaxID=1888910 RepID=UPI001081F5E9|nr:hypothetical protein [Roseovarius aestuariivivens]